MRFKSVVRVVWNELCLKKVFFCMNIVIVSLLFSIGLLVVSLALDLPKEIYKEVKDTELCYFDIGNIEAEDMKYLLDLPMTVESYGINCYWENYVQGLTAKQRKNIIDEAAFFEFEQYRKGYNSKTLRKLNNHIIAGEGWEEADNECLYGYQRRLHGRWKYLFLKK